MSNPLSTTGIHHLALTVANLDRSEDFYAKTLGFKRVAELSPTCRWYSNGSVVMALTLAPNPSKAIMHDVFNENRLGLDHLSFSVASRTVLEQAVRLFDEYHVLHGEIRDLGAAMGICVLAFRDPDNIQVELTSPR